MVEMDRTQMMILGVCAFLVASDLWNAFTPPPSKPHPHDHHDGHHRRDSIPVPKKVLQSAAIPELETVDEPGAGTTVHISFCSSCSYRSTALTMKKMLEIAFPGVDVVLSNYPPPLPKRMLSKLVPGLQIGSIVFVVAGDHIFPRLGYMVPPPWYYTLKQKRFGVIATTWLLGNALQSFLQNTGAFEVECNGELVFSKLRENKFPSELELRLLIARSLGAKDSLPHSGHLI
ncbi:selT-like protein [Cryptomeria japonica]|uniref:selT-like protein n=1 Tax=Cryptomeria japonica TaxID=3369 RepID=UPI0027DAAFEE|nr:selT-like protein [Cryptomeria japonica]